MIRSILGGLADAFADSRVRGLIAFAGSIVLLASVVFWLLEGWTFLDALFFSVATISTVGYGDLVPVTVGGRLFCIVYIFVGLGIFVAAASAVAEVLLARRAQDRGKEADRQ